MKKLRDRFLDLLSGPKMMLFPGVAGLFNTMFLHTWASPGHNVWDGIVLSMNALIVGFAGYVYALRQARDIHNARHDQMMVDQIPDAMIALGAMQPAEIIGGSLDGQVAPPLGHFLSSKQGEVYRLEDGKWVLTEDWNHEDLTGGDNG